MSVDNKDLDHAAQVLDDDHYGLKDVKERILEFLAVRNLTKQGRESYNMSCRSSGNRKRQA